MKNGRVVESGTYADLVKREESQFKKYLNAFKESASNGNKDGTANEQQEGYAEETVEEILDDISAGHHAPSERRLSVRETRRSKRISDSAVDLIKATDKLMTDEMAEREVGKVGKEVYLTWAKAAGGLWVVIPLFMVFAIGEATKIFSNWWLTFWSHAATPDPASQLHFLGIYGLINLGAILADFCRMFVVLYLGLRASSTVSQKTDPGKAVRHIEYIFLIVNFLFLFLQLFSSLLDSTLTAPMSFFDTTPSGRIMNRFSKGT
jgi:hypothetical protein